MKFNDRRDFLYDAELFRRSDTVTARTIYADFVFKHRPKPDPIVFEVDRTTTKIDTVWHMPLTDRTQFSRQLALPMIVRSTRQKWVPDAALKMIVPKRTNQMTFAHDHLLAHDYFPQRGDLIVYGGYRNIIVEVEIPLESYWQQTNVWLGLVCHCEIMVDGDARPVLDSSSLAGAEVSSTPQVKSAE